MARGKLSQMALITLDILRFDSVVNEDTID